MTPEPDLGGVRILFVEDDADTRDLITLTFGMLGATVTAVASVPEGLMAFAQQCPDILLSDTGLPGEDGWALIEKIRALAPERGGRIPAVAVTGFARADDIARSLAAGFDHHLSKPVEMETLVEVVARLLGRGTASA